MPNENKEMGTTPDFVTKRTKEATFLKGVSNFKFSTIKNIAYRQMQITQEDTKEYTHTTPEPKAVYHPKPSTNIANESTLKGTSQKITEEPTKKVTLPTAVKHMMSATTNLRNKRPYNTANLKEGHIKERIIPKNQAKK